MITGAVVSPGHDGAAVLVVHLGFANGATDTLTLDADRATRVLEACETDTPEGLRGHSWRRLLSALEDEGKATP